jgi:hypothetical protein
LADEVINILWNCTGMPFVPLSVCLPLVYQSGKKTINSIRFKGNSLADFLGNSTLVFLVKFNVKYNVEFPRPPMNLPILLVLMTLPNNNHHLTIRLTPAIDVTSLMSSSPLLQNMQKNSKKHQSTTVNHDLKKKTSH